MVPTRFSSVRQTNRPSTARTSFRDDTGLVALRYEKTKPAEPPIPLPPRNPLRTVSTTSIARSNTTATTASRSTAASSVTSFSVSPVVVAPPSDHSPAVTPPTEEHPALRTRLPAHAQGHQENGKRDSGHAATTASGNTIQEEDCEDDLPHSLSQHRYESKFVQLEREGAAPAAVQHIESIEIEGQAQVDRSRRVAAAAPGTPPAAAAGADPSSSPNSPSPSKMEEPFPIQQQQQSSPKKLVKKNSNKHSGFSRVKASEATSTRQAEPMEPRQPRTAGSGSGHPAPQDLPPTPEGSSKNIIAPVSRAASDNSSSIDGNEPFAPLAISIPTDSLLDDAFMSGFSFSKRGSIMFGGKRATTPLDRTTMDPSRPVDNGSADLPPASLSQTQSSELSTIRPGSGTSAADTVSRVPMPLPPPDIRVLSPDIDKESQKVRSLYETGDAINWEDGARFSFCEQLEPTPEVPAEEDSNDPVPHAGNLAPAFATPRSASSFSHYQDSARRDTELAGGLEDWEDVNGADVDRYGFIVPKPNSRISTPTELKSAQYSPRRRNVLHKRDPMGFSSQLGGGRAPSRKVSARSLNTQNSEVSVMSMKSSRSAMRQASNLLPHNRNRRWMDEAGDMLTVSPSLQDIIEEAQVEKISEALKRKEWERSEKWRKMAKVAKPGNQGQGMEFEFDVKNPKLIERTWKGIPDRWRAAAWWSFLSASAKEHEGSPSAEDIVSTFHKLQVKSSPDDVQIDLDVPRTINRHIMFRRRYRGGQRLLFRVLHALSIYFPETGYVQGMASLAATLLCYFDEEKCFVMLVRMWQLRGLDKLYRPGFEGLMTALHEFESTWLNKKVAEKLTDMSIDTTAYGTRWYLTLFNLSIPFPAQLRVWDVFLLLGDTFTQQGAPYSNVSKESSNGTATTPSGLDVLHATSAAIIQALREVLLDSDFENAMKALTSWIPVKDEDLLMKVTKAEWKTHQGKKKT